MIKLSELINKINMFSKQAVWEYRLVRAAKENVDIQQQFEEFDPKNSGLADDFEEFEKEYSAFDELLSEFNPTNKNYDIANQLITVSKRLNAVGDSLLDNEYLNREGDDVWIEDFESSQFAQFVVDTMNNVKEKLKEVLGMEIDLSEVPSEAEQEFAGINEEYMAGGDTKLNEGAAKRKEDAKKAREERKELREYLKKQNPNDERYQRHIANMKKKDAVHRQRMSDDPVYANKVRKGGAVRAQRFRDNPVKERARLVAQLDKVYSQKSRDEILAKIKKIDDKFEETKHKGKQIAKKVKEVKESGSLFGLITHLSQKTASAKSEITKKIKDEIKTAPALKPFEAAVAEAKRAMDANNNPQTQMALSNAQSAYASAEDQFKKNHPKILRIAPQITAIYVYRDKLAELDKTGWLNEAMVPEEIRPHIDSFIRDGVQLVNNINGNFRTSADLIIKIVELLKSKL